MRDEAIDSGDQSTAATKWVYSFGGDGTEGNASLRNLLGGKGANLAEMARIGLPVPPGFTVSTEVCNWFYANDRQYPADLTSQVDQALQRLEGLLGKRFGDPSDPLLLSVRSGARASMPGMMDTVLNLGLNDETVEGLAAITGNKRFAYDSYRRFIQMYCDVVLGVDNGLFEDELETVKRDTGHRLDTDLTAEDWAEVLRRYKALVADALDEPFPQDPRAQLWGAMGAVFGSWMNQRAITYRRLHGLPADWGTAVNVQAMVFGNRGDDCATGVAFTRDPATGENVFYGEYLINAQGEDVVAGTRTPQHITLEAREAAGADLPSMEEVMPDLYRELADIRLTLENHYAEMQDLEFTVESGTLYILQTRTGKRTATAALKIAVDMANEGLISQEEAVRRVDPGALDQLLHPMLDPDAEREVLAKGLPASPGAVSGKIVMSADEAERLTELGERVILVRDETSPEDIHGMHAAVGILTSRGGMTSHAAVVARGMGRACVAGAGELALDMKEGTLTARGRSLSVGDVITLDGATGDVMVGAVPTIEPELSGDFAVLMGWADRFRKLGIRTNAETPHDAKVAVGFGAEGIGLCRTEHMFFDADRIVNVRRMILAETPDESRAALAELLPLQRKDFADLFRIMAGKPVTIRLLDPPLHEFLPKTDQDMADVAEAAGVGVASVRARVIQLAESNPMLGHRGCRLGITHPEIYETQARAIFEAAVEVGGADQDPVTAEIMIPLAFSKAELDLLKKVIASAAEEVEAQSGVALNDHVGTMVELPRAALRAGELAETAEFFSFGTNDLTQTTFGISRDDSASFLLEYERLGVIEGDPFVTIDQSGVGELVQIAMERGRAARPDLNLGICGEHGGDPASIRFCHEIGLDYVSCSPYRVPIARLAAAQAALSIEEGRLGSA
ncbi:MAG: pyruvate, phosphate dikinase [Pseudomonadota bacterium]